MTQAQKDKLAVVCRKFFDGNNIECAETIYQVDRVSENSLEFIEAIGDVIGYSQPQEGRSDSDLNA